MSRKQISNEVLLKVYDSAIAEYRFNVQLSWDRNKFFLTLISAIIASGVGLLKVAQESAAASFFLCALFLIAIAITFLAIETLSSGKKYIREANYKKMLIERELGLLDTLENFSSSRSNFSISVTSGQRDHGSMIFNENVKRQISSRSITDNLSKIYYAMIVIEALGCVISAISIGSLISPVKPTLPVAVITGPPSMQAN